MEKFLINSSKKRANANVIDMDADNNNEPASKTVKIQAVQAPSEDDYKSLPESYIFNGNFFKIIQSEKQNIKAQCAHCPKVISGSRQSTGNFLSHIKRVHQHLLGKVKEQRQLQQSVIKAKNHEATSSEAAAHNHIQATLFAPIPLTKQKVVQLVFNYIAAEMRPLSTVEKPTFKALVEGIANNKSVKTPDRRTITTELESRYLAHKADLIKQIKKQSYVCITADLWTSNNKSYMGMTIHYISEDTFERKSHLLCCKRFTGKHVYSAIAACITSVLNNFEIEIPKVSHIVTDNASNFVKAFGVYGTQELENEIDSSILESENHAHSRDDDNVDWDAETSEDVQMVNLESILAEPDPEPDTSDADTDEIILPSHMRCAVHTLNLVATTDASKALDKSADYKKIYRSTFGKLQAFWNLTSRSTVASDLTYEVCKCKFPVPIMTRWNSSYDATKKILQHKDKIGELFSKLKLQKLKSTEWNFLEEYCSVSEPLAFALDKLQGELECFLGFVAPILFMLRIKLIEISSLVYCIPLKMAIINGIEKRFKHLFDMEDHPAESKAFILSAMSHPKFKTKWIPERLLDHCKNMFITEFNFFTSKNMEDSESETDDSDDFFFKSFSNKGKGTGRGSTVRNVDNSEVDLYLNSKKKELTMLESFTTVKKIFLKYNTTLPSSAPVERLFSSGAQILIPRRNKLSDKHFEMLLTCRSYLKK